MRNTRTIIVSGIVFIVLIFVFRSAEASPSSTSDPVYPDGYLFSPLIPSGIFQSGPEAPDADADLSISIIDFPDPVLVGSSLTYTITVVNNTVAVTATNVVMTDTLPGLVSFVSATPLQGGSCSGTVNVVCNLGSILGGNNSRVVIKVTPGSAGAITNNALVKALETDPVPGNNSASAGTTVSPVADLSLGLSVSTTSPVIGGTLAYTVTVTNAGPSQATGVSVRDLLPSGYAYISNVPTQGAYNSSTGDWTGISLASGANARLRINATVNASGSYSNYAQVVTSGAADPDSTPGNNSTNEDDDDTLATVPVSGADLSLSMTGLPNPVTAGSNLVYTLDVTNLGSANASSVVLTDTLPGGVTYQSASGSGWACSTITGGRVRCTRTSLNNGLNRPITLTVLVTSSTTGVLSNSATLTANTPDPVSTNNTAATTTTVNASANLGVTLSDGPDPVAPGANLTYTVTVSNAGPSDATGVVFTDTLPSGITYQSFTGTGWACTLASLQLRCTLAASLAPSTNNQVVIHTQVNPATPQGTLNSSVVVHSSTSDPATGNNSANTSTSVQLNADLRINVADTVDPVAPGTSMAYTIIVTNNGPSDATGVKITDTLPAGVSYLLHVPTPEWTCSLAGSDVRCSHAASLLANTAYQLSLVVAVDQSVSGVLSNLVRVGATTSDPVSSNNSATETTTVVPQSDLSINMTESSDPVVAGTNLEYTLSISNAGPSNAVNVVVTDTLPSSVTYQSFGGSSGWTCTQLSGNRVRCARSSINFNNNSTLTILTRVNPNASGVINNTGVVSSSGTDPALANNTISVGTTVTQSADLSVTKTDSPDPVPEGQSLTYRVVVKNNGPSNASSVSLNESIPSEVNFISAVPVPQGTCSGSGPVNCNLGTLTAGNSITITIQTTTKLVANQSKSISNTASVSSSTTDPVSNNNSQTIYTLVVPAADLRLNLESSVSQILTGNPLTYTLWITNTGPSIANNVVVTDTLPAGVTYKSSTRTPIQNTFPKVVWNLGNLGAGQSTSFKLVVDVKSITTTLVNMASAKSATVDVTPSNSQDQTSVQAIDNVAPTATFELPVHLGETYYSGGQTVLLEVLATDNVAVTSVKFSRWDALNNVFIDIGYDYSPSTCQFNPSLQCFQWQLNTLVLNPAYNEIRARAKDGSGNESPEPKFNSYIFIYRYTSIVYLPFIRR